MVDLIQRRNGGRAPAVVVPTEEGVVLPLRTVLRGHVLAVLALSGGNKSRAAKLLGISRQALRRWLARRDQVSQMTCDHCLCVVGEDDGVKVPVLCCKCGEKFWTHSLQEHRA